MRAGFDMDFYLDWRWAGNLNGYNILLRNTDTPLTRGGDAGYFNADADTTIKPFLDQYLPQPHDCERAHGLFDLITGNHDTLRVGQRLTARELKLAYGTLLTMPGCPFVYHGDEIAMRYRDLPTFEGGYIRTGSRTPMQRDADEANLGFSAAAVLRRVALVRSRLPAALAEPSPLTGHRASSELPRSLKRLVLQTMSIRGIVHSNGRGTRLTSVAR